MLYDILTFDKSIIFKLKRGRNPDQKLNEIFIYVLKVTAEGFSSLGFFMRFSRLYVVAKKKMAIFHCRESMQKVCAFALSETALRPFKMICRV